MLYQEKLISDKIRNMGLRVYNTLTRRAEEFVPPSEKVNMYVCGITPYDLCHIGHGRCYLVYDVVLRYLRYKGYNVFYVQNFTDIDDKIIHRAMEEGLSAKEVAEKYISAYERDMEGLGVLEADLYPRVTGHIPEIVQLIEGLIQKGFAYEADGSVYYRVAKFTGYGKLSGRTLDDMRAGARVEVNEQKENPLDFALWKAAKEGEPFFESPWGKGRPGWHIECSAMSMKYLGESPTIHGGAIELSFPHHENEIAQSEAYTGKPFVRYWLHCGLVTVEGEKMSKSIGNIVPISSVVQKFDPEAVRLFLLQSHYRSPVDYSEEDLQKAISGMRRVYNTLDRLDEVSNVNPVRNGFLSHGISNGVKAQMSNGKTADHSKFQLKFEAIRHQFEAAMDDDFNTARAIACLFEFQADIHRALDAKSLSSQDVPLIKDTFVQLWSTLGFFQKKQDRTAGTELEPLAALCEKYGLGTKGEPDTLIQRLVDARTKYRSEKDFQKADAVRKDLSALHITLEDKPAGTVWKRERFR